MKLDNPVAASDLFTNHLQLKPQGLWCVAMDLDGTVQALFEPVSQDVDAVVFWLQNICCPAQDNESLQLLFVRVNAVSVFDSWDWGWIKIILNRVRSENLIFCDYLKISSHSYSSLLDLDFIEESFNCQFL